MKSQWRWLMALIGLAVGLAASTTPMRAAHSHGDDETELGGHMDGMNKAFRQLKKQIEDASMNASSIELVAKVKTEAEAAAKLTPEKTADLPEGDRAAFVKGYQEKMAEFVAELDKLTAALKANDNAGAAGILKELGGMQRSGHKEYRKPKDE